MPVALSRALPEQVQTAWLLEARKPLADRQLFKFGETADALVRKPGRQEVDEEESFRIGMDLLRWFQCGEFADAEVLAPFDDPPHFRPLKPLLEDARRQAGHGGRSVAPEWRDLVLTRAALQTYLERSNLEGASRLFREWFPGADRNRTKLLPEPQNKRPGHRTGPRPTLREGIKGRILQDLRAGHRTPAQLQKDTLLALAAQYGGSQNTANLARKEALSEFQNSES